MITMSELVDFRMQQHIAQEIYRHQIMQRLPDPFHHMLPMPLPHHVIMPPRGNLPGVTAKLENNELWQQFHQIGTEMIITKTGRRIFPSLRLSLSGLEDESSYCVLLEMVPISDCRYKFSGSQWVPAGGAEPQSPQRMHLHPDSPATGAHWQSQPLLFNKVKLTNNTLDNNGHMVLASMHKYQPRLHVIRTSDLTHLPWAPQQAFVFPETEFIAVTAYQNDRITKLKIDNNPFAKGFRESGQSRCKRKLSTSPTSDRDQQQHQHQNQSQYFNNEKSIDSNTPADSDRTSVPASYNATQIKRMRSNDSACSSETSTSFDEGQMRRSSENNSPPKIISDAQHLQNLYQRSLMADGDLVMDSKFNLYLQRPLPVHPDEYRGLFPSFDYVENLSPVSEFDNHGKARTTTVFPSRSATPDDSQCGDIFVDVESTSSSEQSSLDRTESIPERTASHHSFSISAILGKRNILSV